MKRAEIDYNIQVFLIKEGDIFVCHCPALDLASHGDSFDDAVRAFHEALGIFIKEVIKMGTLNQVLMECGWTKKAHNWLPPLVVGQQTEKIRIPVPA